jgi:hypothetical protein
MADEERPALSASQVAAYARETGATEAQIQEIVRLIGTNHASILREARAAAKPKK